MPSAVFSDPCKLSQSLCPMKLRGDHLSNQGKGGTASLRRGSPVCISPPRAMESVSWHVSHPTVKDWLNGIRHGDDLDPELQQDPEGAVRRVCEPLRGP